MRGIFRNLDIKSLRLTAGLTKAHDRFYHKLVKGKREDLVRKVGNFINRGRSETDQRRGLRVENSATANYLTPFERKEEKLTEDGVQVTDYGR